MVYRYEFNIPVPKDRIGNAISEARKIMEGMPHDASYFFGNKSPSELRSIVRRMRGTGLKHQFRMRKTREQHMNGTRVWRIEDA